MVQDAVCVRAQPIRAHNRVVTFSRGIILSVGGPAFVYWVSPTEEELFKARRL